MDSPDQGAKGIPVSKVDAGGDTIKAEKVFLDGDGVIRWRESKEEVALFGANYCLPSACDYRAAGYVGKDRKRAIDEDMTHFARMGWDGLRLCLWGDWENSDRDGNLIANEHLDLLDYLILKAKERSISMLLSPIVTYSSLFPEGGDEAALPGFTRHFGKSELGKNAEAIAAQTRFLTQLLDHVNPYTGTALKDEPDILFIEMINEPEHNCDDRAGSVSYINALVDAVRSTGCDKILFHNVSQDFRIVPALRESKIQGASFAWYPTGLVFGRTLRGNFLRTVDEYPPMLAPELAGLAKIVYEFDHPDSLSNAMYPAMARTFRSVGAQFAAMFSYDMLATAAFNLGWQTHFLNLVYTPNKAASAIIAAQVMKRLPRMGRYGGYPGNTSFGPFRVSYEQDSSELAAPDMFMYANGTTTVPPDPSTLERIVGCGSSPLVSYGGRGIYFLDRIDRGLWRLELYPDAVIVSDPFAQQSPGKIVSRVIHRRWPMEIHLPDLGETFSVHRIDAAGTGSIKADKGEFSAAPGVFIITAGESFDPASLPKRVGRVGMREFVCPDAPELPPHVVTAAREAYLSGEPMDIDAEVFDKDRPREVILHARQEGEKKFHSFAMDHSSGYRYRASVPAGTFAEGWIMYCISVSTDEGAITFPEATGNSPADWDFHDQRFWKTSIVNSRTPLPLLSAGEDAENLAFTRIGDDIRHGIYRVVPGSDTGKPVLRLTLPLSLDAAIDDYTASLSIKEKIAPRTDVKWAKGLVVRARGLDESQEVHFTLVEADGTSWGAALSLGADWRDLFLPLERMEMTRGVKLPHGFPERWNYWLTPAEGRGKRGDHIRLEAVEWLQLSLRPSRERAHASDRAFEIASVTLVMEGRSG
jgi:hypothetical protein